LEAKLAATQKALQEAEFAAERGGKGGNVRVRGRSPMHRMIRQAIGVLLIALLALAFIPRMNV
jgi:tRNA U38,U39,U40 pseudouridine synthase TruA